MAQNQLTHALSRVAVDIDSMDPTVAEHFTKAGVKFTDMTSNQAFVSIESARPERADLVKTAIAQIKATEPTADLETQVLDAVDLITVLLGKSVFPYLSGRVHAQTSPLKADDIDATIKHAQKLVSLFEANGVPRDRVCIKVPSTPEGILACKSLQAQGISTLATSLFSVPQAIASHQAGCLYIAPWLNELRVHFEPSLWKEYADTAKEHPQASIIREITKLYKELGSKTLVMPASIVTGKEAFALLSLNPDHLTLSSVVLEQLIATPFVESAGGTEANGAADTSDVKTVDYLADNAKVLRERLAAQTEPSRKLADALKVFGEFELKTRELVRGLLSA
ncbi:aldolase [Fomes fomentarius]|nr:aldolase [Fomes fomentarius]